MTFNWQRYMAYYIGSLLAMIVIVQILAMVGLNLQSSGLSLIPAMIAALVEGQKYAKANAGPLTQPWKDALGMTGIAIGIILLMTAFVLASVPQIRAGLLNALPLFIGVLAAFCIILLGLTRLFYGMGARSVWKARK